MLISLFERARLAVSPVSCLNAKLTAQTSKWYRSSHVALQWGMQPVGYMNDQQINTFDLVEPQSGLSIIICTNLSQIKDQYGRLNCIFLTKQPSYVCTLSKTRGWRGGMAGQQKGQVLAILLTRSMAPPLNQLLSTFLRMLNYCLTRI